MLIKIGGCFSLRYLENGQKKSPENIPGL